MSKEKCIALINQNLNDFVESYSGLPHSDFSLPGVCGEWSIKNIISHVTCWEQESLKHLPIILAGGSPPRYSTTYGGIDAFNAIEMEKRKDLDIVVVLLMQKEVHQKLMNFLAGVPEEQFYWKTRFRRRLKWDTYKHYPLHAADIRKWRITR